MRYNEAEMKRQVKDRVKEMRKHLKDLEAEVRKGSVIGANLAAIRMTVWAGAVEENLKGHVKDWTDDRR